MTSEAADVEAASDIELRRMYSTTGSEDVVKFEDQVWLYDGGALQADSVCWVAEGAGGVLYDSVDTVEVGASVYGVAVGVGGGA